MRSHPRHFWPMIAVLLLAAALGIRGLDIDALWGDELFSIRDSGGAIYSQRSLGGVWAIVAEGQVNNSPPGYFLLLNLWERLVGWEPAALRALSLFAGLLAVAGMYRFGAEQVSPKAGLYAAATLAASAFFVHYLHEVRNYTLLVLTTVFALWAYFHVLRSKRLTPLAWFSLAVAVAALLYNHYFGLVTLGVLGLYHLLFAPKTRRWWSITAAALLGGLLFVPWLPVFLQTASGSSGYADARPVGTLLTDIGYLFANGLNVLLVALGAVAVLGAVAGHDRAARRALILPGLFLAVFLLLHLLTGQVRKPTLRYVLVLWPALALLSGLGLWLLERPTVAHSSLPSSLRSLTQRLVPMLVVVWLAVGVWNVLAERIPQGIAGTERWSPIHRVARAVEPLAQPEDALLYFLPDGLERFRYSTSRLITDFYFRDFPALDYQPTTTVFPASTAAVDAESRKALVSDRQRVWVAHEPREDSAAYPAFVDWLQADAGYSRCEPAVSDADLILDQYVRSRICCVAERAESSVRLSFAPGIHVLDAALATGAGTPTLATFWQLDANVPPNAYSASIQLLDQSGTKVAQSDFGLMAIPLPCHQTELSTTGLPPGEYAVVVGVYPWQTGDRVQGTDPGTGVTSDLLPVGTLTLP